jgi:hypothetical protein
MPDFDYRRSMSKMYSTGLAAKKPGLQAHFWRLAVDGEIRATRWGITG